MFAHWPRLLAMVHALGLPSHGDVSLERAERYLCGSRQPSITARDRATHSGGCTQGYSRLCWRIALVCIGGMFYICIPPTVYSSTPATCRGHALKELEVTAGIITRPPDCGLSHHGDVPAYTRRPVQKPEGNLSSADEERQSLLIHADRRYTDLCEHRRLATNITYNQVSSYTTR